MNFLSRASGTFLRSLPIRRVTESPSCPLGECWESAHLFQGSELPRGQWSLLPTGQLPRCFFSSPLARVCHPPKMNGNLSPRDYQDALRKCNQYLLPIVKGQHYIWGIWIEGLWGYFILFLCNFCSSENISKYNVR